MAKKALITGVTGQDGSYLSEFLLEKIAEDYEGLKAEYAKLKGELAMRKRGQYCKSSENPKDEGRRL